MRIFSRIWKSISPLASRCTISNVVLPRIHSRHSICCDDVAARFQHVRSKRNLADQQMMPHMCLVYLEQSLRMTMNRFRRMYIHVYIYYVMSVCVFGVRFSSTSCLQFITCTIANTVISHYIYKYSATYRYKIWCNFHETNMAPEK